MSGGHRRRAAIWLIVALALVLGSSAEARKKDKRAIDPARLPEWVKEAVQRAPAKSEHDVVWLHDEGIVEPNPAGGMKYTYRIAGKAFNSSGLEILGDWSVYFYEGDRIDRLRAFTIHPDGTARRADPDEDMTESPAIQSALMFTDARVKEVEAQGVTLGSVVAFEYVIWMQLDAGAMPFIFGAASRPTVLTRFELRVPEGWDWDFVTLRDAALEVERSANGVVILARELKPLKRESRRPAANRLLPQVWAHWRSPDGEHGYKDWDAVGNWFRDLNEAALNEPGEAAEIAARLQPADTQEWLAALGQAFEFAARDVRYVSIDIGLGIGAGYEVATPAAVCDKRYGDCKDKAYLMRALARPWGVKTYPVLVRTRRIVPLAEEVPTPQFNHCITAIEIPEGVDEDLWAAETVEGIGRVVFLDSTASKSSPWALPWQDQGTVALLIHPEGGKLIRLPLQPPEAGSTQRALQVEVDEQGSVVAGELTEKWTGSSAANVRSYYDDLNEDQHQRKVLEDLHERFPGTTMIDYRIEGLEEIQQPVEETIRIQGGRLGKLVGDLLILELGKAGYGLLGATLPKPPRNYPYVLGRPREEHLRITVRPPAGWIPETLPEGLEVDSAYLKAHATWSMGDAGVTYDRFMSFLEEEVPPTDYPDFRELFNRVRAEDRKAIVLVRDK